MSLLHNEWLKKAYDNNGTAQNKHWDAYTPKEESIYQNFLENKLTRLETTVEGLAQQYDMPTYYAVGFIDGINECLPQPIDTEALEAESEVIIEFDFETLFKKMVEYKAENLYTLEAWDNIFDAETQKKLYDEQKMSTTFIRKEKKIGRNDPCPCGSSKKYKFCCESK